MLYKWVMRFWVAAFAVIIVIGLGIALDDSGWNGISNLHKTLYFFAYGFLLGGWFIDAVYKKSIGDIIIIPIILILGVLGLING